MLQKDKSTTKSSKSATSKAPPSARGIDAPIQFLKGVGPKLGILLAGRGLPTIRDILLFFPRAYEDRTQITPISSLQEGQRATLPLRVISSHLIPIRKLNRTLMEVRCTDDAGTGSLSLKWFRVPRGMERRFTPGSRWMATGMVKMYQGKREIVHPELAQLPEAGGEAAPTGDSAHHSRLVPIYVEVEGIASRILRNLIWSALDKHLDELVDELPTGLQRKHALPGLREAVRALHFPPEDFSGKIESLMNGTSPFHARLAYEEFLKFEYIVLKRRLAIQKERAEAFGTEGGAEAAAALEKMLPFKLTKGQKEALKDIMRDIAQPHPANRLIQGDVGSGKTAVAFLAASVVLAEGGQAALLAPTEILVEQHYKNAVKLFGGKLPVAILTGSTSTADRRELLARLKAGKPLLVIGTHALIEDDVEFRRLSLCLIDEQHRFGVEQRRKLRNKGLLPPLERGGRPGLPHFLVLTATPIPRTLALTAYGDLAVSSIRERPPGRTPIKTEVLTTAKDRARAVAWIRQEIREGRQAYWIVPLVEESEAEGFERLKNAVHEAERLQTQVFPEFKVGLLHGQMASDQKEAIMGAFSRGETQLLVSTTVVEVGVDVPNATCMVIEHAERFGLSQLHQLRGRVGRGEHPSSCFLLSHPGVVEASARRLEVLESTEDGFKIAEADLEIRGPGEFLGTRQAGSLPFKMANLVRDRDWLIKARDDAEELLRTDPSLSLPENASFKRYLERYGKLQSERLGTS